MFKKLYIHKVHPSLNHGKLLFQDLSGMCRCNRSVRDIIKYGEIGFKRDMRAFGKIKF